MFNIIPLILIIISLGIIIVIVVRKFSVLAALDVDTIQAEREAKFKEQIISSRLKRSFFKYYSRILRILRPAGGAIANFFKLLYKKLLEYRDNYAKEEKVEAGSGQIISSLAHEAEELMREEKFEEAEKKYIEIISLDAKNIKAFKELGQLYYERKDFNEAKQTLEHALELVERDYDPRAGEAAPAGEENIDLNTKISGLYYDLSLNSRAMESEREAFINIKKALKIEPNNPRYLDTLLEISIINKDKGNALTALDKLKEVNPENQKLDELKKQIDEL